MLNCFGLSCAGITFLMSILHFLLVAGAPLGEYVLGGKDRVIPKEKRYISGILSFVFLLMGMLYLQKADIISVNMNELITKIIMSLYTLFLGYAIIGNTFFTSSKKEKIVMIPASCIGFICSLVTLIFSW